MEDSRYSDSNVQYIQNASGLLTLGSWFLRYSLLLGGIPMRLSNVFASVLNAEHCTYDPMTGSQLVRRECESGPVGWAS